MADENPTKQSRDKRNRFQPIPLEERFWAKVEKSPDAQGCWLWRGTINHRGYGQITVNGQLRRAPRVSYELAFGPIPDGLWVLHHCDTPACVRPDHLWLGTVTDNNADRVAKGRDARGIRNGAHVHPERRAYGERNGSAKLKWQVVLEIRKANQSGETGRSIARRLGFGKSTINRILNGEAWKTGASDER